MATTEKTEVKFSEARKQEIERIRGRYETPRGLIMPLLWMIQDDYGWISYDAMELIAGECETSPAWVYSIATFYTMFELEKPIRYHLQVCNTLSCGLCGSESILAHLEDRLGIQAGESTEDGRFRLTAVECLASCGTGPMMQMNDEYYESLTTEKVDAMLEEWNCD